MTALDAYTQVRDELCPRPIGPKLSGHQLRPAAGQGDSLARVRQAAPLLRLDRETLGRQARVHDFRHSFVLRTLLNWYQDDVDIEARLPLLSTFLGRVHPSDTYWSFEAAPQLLAFAAQRLDDIWEQRP